MLDRFFPMRRNINGEVMASNILYKKCNIMTVSLVLALLLAVVAPIQLYRIHGAFGFIPPMSFLFLIVPPLLFLVIAYVLKKYASQKGVIHGICLVVIIGVLLCYGLLSLGLESFLSIRSITDVRKYNKILKKWKKFAPDIVQHFPESIPSTGYDVDFYFKPGFLQSDSEIQLRFKTTPEEINEYYKKFSALATKSYRGRELIHFLPHKKECSLIELSEDYETLQFDKDPNRIPEHGKQHGVIISGEKNDIIFWAEW